MKLLQLLLSISMLLFIVIVSFFLMSPAIFPHQLNGQKISYAYTTNSHTMPLSSGTIIAGNDILVTQTRNFDDCRLFCDRLDLCVAAAWTQTINEIGSGKCKLKYSIESIEPQVNGISAVKIYTLTDYENPQKLELQHKDFGLFVGAKLPNGINVYANNSYILYIMTSCNKLDMTHKFFLHLYQNNRQIFDGKASARTPPSVNVNFVNRDFDWDTTKDTAYECSKLIDSRDISFSKIETGQYDLTKNIRKWILQIDTDIFSHISQK